MIHLDTHITMWLFSGAITLLSKKATQLIETEDLYISPIVILELEYLHEIGRAKAGSTKVIKVLEKDLGLRVSELSFALVAEQALIETWTRDPFDRLIVAQAKAENVDLLTKDESIHLNFRRAVWE